MRCEPTGSCAANGVKPFYFDPERQPLDHKENKLWFTNYTTQVLVSDRGACPFHLVTKLPADSRLCVADTGRRGATGMLCTSAVTNSARCS